MSDSAVQLFDVEFATNQFSGNKDILLQILQKFSEQYQGSVQSIKAEYHQDKIENVRRHVHTLKGVSGNLGMQALYTACKQWEQHRLEPSCEQQLDEFLATLAKTLTVISDFQSHNSKEQTASTETGQNDQVTKELVALLQRNEFLSHKKMQSYLPSLALSADTQVKLLQAIDDLDYPSAIEILS